MLAGPAIAEMKAIWQQRSAGSRRRALASNVARRRSAHQVRVEMLPVRALDAYHAARPRRPRKIDPSVTAIKTQLS
jgi:hypothetical protein